MQIITVLSGFLCHQVDLSIYDVSITKPDLGCDGIIDTLDSDIDGDEVQKCARYYNSIYPYMQKRAGCT